MITKPLTPQEPATQQGARASQELIEVIQRLHEAVKDLQATVANHEARITALEP